MKIELKIVTKIRILFAILAILVGLNIIIVNYYKQKEKADTVIVDIAGRNRMLSQKIALLSEIFIKDKTVQKELGNVIKMHHLSFIALRDGGKAPSMNSETSMPAAHNDAMPIIKKVEVQWTEYKKNAENIIRFNNDPDKQLLALKYLETHRNKMLSINNELVKVFVEINAKKQSKLKTILIITFLIDVISLLFGLMLINKELIVPVKKIANQALVISKGNLINNLKIERKDEIGELSNSINSITENFKELIGNIAKTAETVLDASKGLSTVSQGISQSAFEQSSTTEEISSSTEQMIVTINTNAEYAEYSEKTSIDSANEMKQSNEIFVKTIIEISEKITIISEIAKKTNILSINAAIEAARAGDQGKGFAVVAQEIKNLADKSRMASDEINELSKNGQDISKSTSEKLAKTIPEIIKSAKLVNSILSASSEQQNAIGEINDSIQQLSKITMKNSTSAEEMSASADQLSAQAEQLKQMISVFKI